ncbi:FtsW/RodA/SpoVE family cell cycle protein [Butyrivibrio sp.]|uniref:FtsW/RodA/SpoVE family cell cycle protein n=1 Tax=Butyrivibrio sp. TaxID=28121 RepID=UPI001B646D45|nr:FtsW/RodA/SpoVE family cell cycle protein [Butyrivibrio sp.]MBE5839259.1 FtsW/RodA/SpoVE family cell cycle protein [Butyrivibrio sp.]MBP3819211.1 FtsW/RodA/SpoVE family cell cycle protein [Butyrivibrio sp.]
MELYVTEISKYVIAFLMFLYTLEAFVAFRWRTEKKRTGLYIRQIILMFAVQIACFVQIMARTGKPVYLFFFAFQIIAFSSVLLLFYVIYPDGNRLIINNSCMLMMIGLIMLTRLSYDRAVKQFFIIVASFVVGFIVPEIIFRFEFLKKFTWIYAALGIVAIGIVLLLGAVTNGSKISYTIGGITLQPSEFVKILFLFFMAGALDSAENIWQLFLASAVAAIHVIILVLSKDLGSALIFFVIYLALIYISTENVGYLAIGLSFGALASVIAYKLFSHIQVRVQAWLDPFSDIESTGYQLSQSLFGISSGGWFGLGLYGGTPKSIPFVEQDFIFSAIAEEMGVIFAVLMALICVSTFIEIMRLGYFLRDTYYRLVVCGIGVAYIFQTFLTIGGGSKFIPLTGVTLPFVSYGGSSVLVTIMMIMITQGIFMIRTDERYEAIERMKRRRENERRKEY